MGRKFFGIDIRSDAVSAVLVDNSIKGNIIDAHLHIPLSTDPEDEAGGNGLSEALEMITQEMNITDAVSVASFPADQISYRNIQVPFGDHRVIGLLLGIEESIQAMV